MNAANTDLFYQLHGFAMWDFPISTQSCIQTRTWTPPEPTAPLRSWICGTERGLCLCRDTPGLAACLSTRTAVGFSATVQRFAARSCGRRAAPLEAEQH